MCLTFNTIGGMILVDKQKRSDEMRQQQQSARIQQVTNQIAQSETLVLRQNLEEMHRLMHRPALKIEVAQLADPAIKADMILMVELITAELDRR